MALDVEKVLGRLEGDLEPHERFDAEEAMEDLAGRARLILEVSEDSPLSAAVERIVYSATVRYMRNYLGLTVTRAGDETLGWDGIGDKAGSPYFTEDEEQAIRSSVRRNAGFAVGSVSAYSTRRTGSGTSYVPTEGGGKPFPFRVDGEP